MGNQMHHACMKEVITLLTRDLGNTINSRTFQYLGIPQPKPPAICCAVYKIQYIIMK